MTSMLNREVPTSLVATHGSLEQVIAVSYGALVDSYVAVTNLHGKQQPPLQQWKVCY
ncbi:hypothetical protein N9927_04370 [Akkermansiaceae bacterium]|nr:hypothetical protein [Akkermansiaceae bacterium]